MTKDDRDHTKFEWARPDFLEWIAQLTGAEVISRFSSRLSHNNGPTVGWTGLVAAFTFIGAYLGIGTFFQRAEARGYRKGKQEGDEALQITELLRQQQQANISEAMAEIYGKPVVTKMKYEGTIKESPSKQASV